jgi:rod shape-determining protein MreD
VRLPAALLVLLPASVIQSSLISRAELAGAYPNLVLVLVVAWCWLRGAPRSLSWAVLGGLLCDLLGPGPLGLSGLRALLARHIRLGPLEASVQP